MRQLKRKLMDSIAGKIKDEYPSQRKACEALGVNQAFLSACNTYREGRLSMDKLIEMVEKLGGEVSIDVRFNDGSQE